MFNPHRTDAEFEHLRLTIGLEPAIEAFLDQNPKAFTLFPAYEPYRRDLTSPFELYHEVVESGDLGTRYTEIEARELCQALILNDQTILTQATMLACHRLRSESPRGFWHRTDQIKDFWLSLGFVQYVIDHKLLTDWETRIVAKCTLAIVHYTGPGRRRKNTFQIARDQIQETRTYWDQCLKEVESIGKRSPRVATKTYAISQLQDFIYNEVADGDLTEAQWGAFDELARTLEEGRSSTGMSQSSLREIALVCLRLLPKNFYRVRGFLTHKILR